MFFGWEPCNENFPSGSAITSDGKNIEYSRNLVENVRLRNVGACLHLWKFCSVASYNLVFCSVLSRDFFGSIFLAQCLENLYNVATQLAATGYKNRRKVMLPRRQFTGLRNIIWSLLGNIAQGFQLRDFVPKELRQHSKEFFRVQCCLEPFGQHCKTYLSVQSVQCCPMKM